MRYAFIFTTAIFIAVLGYYFFPKSNLSFSEKEQPPAFPGDYFYEQRTWPHGRMDRDFCRKTLLEIEQKNKTRPRNSAEWTYAGATNVSGRVSALAVNPAAPSTIYVGAASGGVFKTTDNGAHWTPIFDNAPNLSIGDIALAPSNPQVVYVGTGEANCGGGSLAYDGIGVFKSTDGGQAWQHVGLENIGNVGKILVHPSDPNTLYVAAAGDLFANSSERGIYKSADGGASWQQSLFVSDSTGGIDLAFHPSNPNIVYAAMWERIRRPNGRQYGGLTSGIYKTMDGGAHWQKLSGGLPQGSLGRIGLAVSPNNPEVVYALVNTTDGTYQGLYLSTNQGGSWTAVDPSAFLGGYPFNWWFGKIYADPSNADRVFVPAFTMSVSEDAGQSWNDASGFMHVDHHVCWIDPSNPNHLLDGNDGGIYYSMDGGFNWTKWDLPITQFYTVDVDESAPERLYGGAQDNGTNRTVVGGTDDWEHILGGDGFVVKVDPTNNLNVYAEYQYGNFFASYNGGSQLNPAKAGITPNDRFNWNTPFILDPTDPQTLYIGAQRVYRSTNGAQSWTPISSDLTDGAAGYGGVIFGTITCLAASPLEPGVVYAGTDDGNLWYFDGTGNWENRSLSLPKRWVTHVETSPFDPNTAYVTFSGLRWHEAEAHIYKTTDRGLHWTPVSGDLPEMPVNDLIIDPAYAATLYAATDAGVFVSENEGQHWEPLGTGMPTLVVTDLRLHEGTRKLVAATYGRGMYTVALETVRTAGPVEGWSVRGSNNPLQSGTATVTLSGTALEVVTCSITDVSGRVISQRKIKTQGGEAALLLPRELFPKAGVYICSMETGKGKAVYKLLVL